MRDDAVLRRALPLGRGLGRNTDSKTCIQCVRHSDPRCIAYQTTFPLSDAVINEAPSVRVTQA